MRISITLLFVIFTFSLQSQTFEIYETKNLETNEKSEVEMKVQLSQDTIYISKMINDKINTRKGVIRSSYKVKNKYLGNSINYESIIQNEPVLLDITYKPNSNKKFILLTEVNILTKEVIRDKLFLIKS